MRARPRPSLKARAIGLLARREHSRGELRRKLLQSLRTDAMMASRSAAAAQAASAVEAEVETAAEADEPADASATVDALLDWLEANDYLSSARFTESRLHARAPRFGNERIRRELAQHGMALEPEALQALKDSELSRARVVWAKKFSALAIDASGRAKQAQFLAARGFSTSVIMRVVKGLGDE